MSKLIDISGQKFKYLTVLNRHGIDKTKKTTWLCLCVCGNTTIATGLNLKSGNTKSCGCKKHLSGIENPRTITDPARIAERKRRLGTLKAWKRKIIERDKRCAKCGSTDNLHAHHIVGFSESVHLRTELSNGIALCGKCHMGFHNQYGRKTKFNEANLNEWLVGVPERSPIISTQVIEDESVVNIFEYITRYKGKHGVEDLQKARHYLDKLIETLTEDESWTKQTK